MDERSLRRVLSLMEERDRVTARIRDLTRGGTSDDDIAVWAFATLLGIATEEWRDVEGDEESTAALGHFRTGALAGRSVSVQFDDSAGYSPLRVPEGRKLDYHLIVIPPQVPSYFVDVPTEGAAYLFDVQALRHRVKPRGGELPIEGAWWDEAELYPNSNSPALTLTPADLARLRSYGFLSTT